MGGGWKMSCKNPAQPLLSGHPGHRGITGSVYRLQISGSRASRNMLRIHGITAGGRSVLHANPWTYHIHHSVLNPYKESDCSSISYR
ncbi:hypothetical protein GDO81_000304 [Engystomops pustulosus]|uniref:Uncharacterized protein n=1 Tax=Engystomops pustulosus TaxID=76066 RepID=A0AAV7D2X4_ENGPU|nr:hypothetical protein GDO81_000304 [Engystomops pustulosus]